VAISRDVLFNCAGITISPDTVVQAAIIPLHDGNEKRVTRDPQFKRYAPGRDRDQDIKFEVRGKR
jgi:hypothetical protein